MSWEKQNKHHWCKNPGDNHVRQSVILHLLVKYVLLVSHPGRVKQDCQSVRLNNSTFYDALL